jgi:hypothetical protein
MTLLAHKELMRQLVWLILWTLTLQFGICAAASSGSALLTRTPPATATGTVDISPVKRLRKGVDAWPLIISPINPATRRVNSVLTLLNQKLASSLSRCDSDYLRWLSLVGESADQHSGSGDWLRTVEITMTGPRYVSLVASQEVFCGGAHPDSNRISMVFYLANGNQVNWPALLPKSAETSAHMDTDWEGNRVSAVISPQLLRIAVVAARSNCKNAFRSGQSFLIWPDAKRQKLVVFPFDLPHSVQACAEEIYLTMDQARKLGFDEDLLHAISQAHRSATSPSSDPPPR